MRLHLALAAALAFSAGAIGASGENGYIDYTVTVTGARQLKAHVRTEISCHVLAQTGLKDEHGLVFGFQFDGETPCGDQPWTNDTRGYDSNAITEVYIGVAGDQDVPGFGRAQFANNPKAHSSVRLRADGTGTIQFDDLENQRQEFVSGTIEFKYVRHP